MSLYNCQFLQQISDTSRLEMDLTASDACGIFLAVWDVVARQAVNGGACDVHPSVCFAECPQLFLLGESSKRSYFSPHVVCEGTAFSMQASSVGEKAFYSEPLMLFEVAFMRGHVSIHRLYDKC